jgi:transcription elongation factor Elf1
MSRPVFDHVVHERKSNAASARRHMLQAVYQETMPKAVERTVGPRHACPACGTARVSDPVYCTPSKRAMIGFLVWCQKDGKHLHQKCTVCGCRWECTPTEIKP